MIIKVTERFYREGKKKWLKHGSHNTGLVFQDVKRTTVWLFFIPVLYWEKIIKCNL